MTKLLSNPTVRLALRALVAGLGVVAAAYVHTGSIGKGVIVSAILVFAELFTPLNPLVGIFKGGVTPTPAPGP